MNVATLPRLLRYDQWIKNLFVLAPAFFGGVLLDSSLWRALVVAFFAFSLLSSSIYIVNDIVDQARDRLHPKKCLRPIASGAVSLPVAWIIAALLLMIAVALPLVLLPRALWCQTLGIMGSYWLLNVCYSYLLKRIAVVDVVSISVGFVLRVLLGGVVAGVVVSEWLLVMTLLLSLFLALAKRRDDYLLYERSGVAMRQAIKGYNRSFLDHTLTMIVGVLLICYLLYTLSAEVHKEPGGDYLYLTALPVLVGLLRYLQITLVEERSGSPTQVVYRDAIIGICVVVWGVLFGLLRYVV
ncbi:UbiA prenyltransferase family protein [Porphyromonas uenonis]|uniref:UbiA prenyltransferase family protein n=1 Tax=Porphyromonas uenonis TaxID=281920 RepID=UPI0026EC233B|nr:UbiA prenyltransferase family protein [Porphyromonas uenonis]